MTDTMTRRELVRAAVVLGAGAAVNSMASAVPWCDSASGSRTTSLHRQKGNHGSSMPNGCPTKRKPM